MKRNDSGGLIAQWEALSGGAANPLSRLANAAALLFDALPDVSWAGFYLARGGALELGPFQGKPACVSIPFGMGVCGAAAERGEAIIVRDVREFPGHIACDEASRSEIVIPLIDGGRVVGALDIDSASVGRFGEGDGRLLTEFAALVAADAGRVAGMMGRGMAESRGIANG